MRTAHVAALEKRASDRTPPKLPITVTMVFSVYPEVRVESSAHAKPQYSIKSLGGTIDIYPNGVCGY